jgi:hypothetical protein
VSPHRQRVWPWWQQTLDVVTAALGFGIAVVMAYRNSWPLPAVVFVMVLLGRITARSALGYFAQRWAVGEKEPPAEE